MAKAVELLTRSSRSRVHYFALPVLLEGQDWDEGELHRVTMGVGFSIGDQTVLAFWGDAFGRFGLEVGQVRGQEVFKNDSKAIDVSHHPWWSGWIGSKMTARLLWSDLLIDSTSPAPVALAVGQDTHQTRWIVAAEPQPGGTVWFGADELVVVTDTSTLNAAAPPGFRLA